MSKSYNLTPPAYAIPLLHAAAHPESTVTGLLLGSRGAGDSATSQASQIQVKHAVPLVHRYASLSMATEIGIDLAEAYAKNHGLEIVGFYTANADASTKLDGSSEVVAKGLKEQFGAELVLVLDNSKLSGNKPVYEVSPPGLHITYPDEHVRVRALALIRNHAGEGLHQQLRDLDDHLQDSRDNFLENPKVVAEITSKLV